MAPLTDTQTDWLDKLGATADAATSGAALRQAKKTALESVDAQLDTMRDDIRSDLESIELRLKPDGFWGEVKAAFDSYETIRLLEPGGEPMKEIDTWHDTKNIEDVTEEQFRVIVQAMDKINRLAEEMRQMTDPDTGLALFPDDAAIARDLWEPLVREGVIPENLVPDRYSEVATTFAATAELYDAAIQKKSEEMSTPEKLLERFAPVVAVTADLTKIAASGMTIDAGIMAFGADVKSISDFPDAADMKAHADIVSAVALCLTSGKTVADKIVAKDLTAAADSFLLAFQTTLSAALGSDGRELAKFITDISIAAVRTVPAGAALKEGKIDEFFEQAGKAIGSALASVDKGDEGTLRTTGEILEGSVGFIVNSVRAAQKAKAGDNLAALQAGLDSLNEAAKTAAGQVVAHFREKALEAVPEDAEDREAALAKVQGKFDKYEAGVEGISDQGEKAAELPVSVKELMEKARTDFDTSQAAQIARAAAKATDDQINELLNQPDPDFEAMLVYGFGDAPSDDPSITEEFRLNSIETVLAELKKQQKIFEMAETITTKGLGAVTKFVPGVEIAAVLSELCFAIATAVRKAKDFNNWALNIADASAAHTVQLDAMMNRYKLADRQKIVANINVGLDAIKLIGAGMKVAGQAAPIGVAVQAGVTGTQAAMDAALKVTEEIEMARAWRTYERALKIPQDRKLAREAFRQNPTLSKYAMAYGACVVGNPIAEEAMRRCGLNALTLANPGTNVTKVVTYLETLYKDDPKLLKAQPVKKAWYPDSVELTMSGWVSFCKAAWETAEPKLENSDVSGIINAFLDHDAAFDAFDNDGSDPAGAKDAAEALIAALRRFSPKQAGSSDDHKEMKEYVAALVSQAADRITLYNANIAA